MSNPIPPPPGWYPDPEGGGQRYWDGTDWTEQRAPQRFMIPWQLQAAAIIAAVFVVLWLFF